MNQEKLYKYPDEPHPNNEFKWKAWWVKKTHRPHDFVCLQWLQMMWQNTLATWHLREIK